MIFISENVVLLIPFRMDSGWNVHNEIRSDILHQLDLNRLGLVQQTQNFIALDYLN